MAKYAIKKRCIRCLHVLDAAGNCTNEKCIKYVAPTRPEGEKAAEGPQEA